MRIRRRADNSGAPATRIRHRDLRTLLTCRQSVTGVLWREASNDWQIPFCALVLQKRNQTIGAIDIDAIKVLCILTNPGNDVLLEVALVPIGIGGRQQPMNRHFPAKRIRRPTRMPSRRQNGQLRAGPRERRTLVQKALTNIIRKRPKTTGDDEYLGT